MTTTATATPATDALSSLLSTTAADDEKQKQAAKVAAALELASQEDQDLAEDDNAKGEFKCDVCDKTYNRKSDLSVHMRAHTGEKPFKCADCDKCFTKKSHLTRHKKIHTGEKPFVCGICQKRHARMSDLKVHLRIHTGERPYKCRVCNKSFITSSHVRMHERTHDQSRRYSCDLCTKTFKTKPGLNQHLKTSHHLPKAEVKVKTALAAKKAMETESNRILSQKLELLEKRKQLTDTASNDLLDTQQQRSPWANSLFATNATQSTTKHNINNSSLAASNAAIINASGPPTSMAMTPVAPLSANAFSSFPQIHTPASQYSLTPSSSLSAAMTPTTPSSSSPATATSLPFLANSMQPAPINDSALYTADGDVQISPTTLRELPPSVVNQLFTLGIIRSGNQGPSTSMQQFPLQQQMPMISQPQGYLANMSLPAMPQMPMHVPQQHMQAHLQQQQQQQQQMPFDVSALTFQSIKEESEPLYFNGLGAASDDFILLRDGDMPTIL